MYIYKCQDFLANSECLKKQINFTKDTIENNKKDNLCLKKINAVNNVLWQHV